MFVLLHNIEIFLMGLDAEGWDGITDCRSSSHPISFLINLPQILKKLNKGMDVLGKPPCNHEDRENAGQVKTVIMFVMQLLTNQERKVKSSHGLRTKIRAFGKNRSDLFNVIDINEYVL